MWHFLSNMVVAISVDTKYAEFLFFHTIQLLRLRKERKREREKKHTCNEWLAIYRCLMQHCKKKQNAASRLKKSRLKNLHSITKTLN